MRELGLFITQKKRLRLILPIYMICFKYLKRRCGALTLAGCHMPTKAVPSLPLLSWTEERKYKRFLGLGKDRKDHLPITLMRNTISDWGNIF